MAYLIKPRVLQVEDDDSIYEIVKDLAESTRLFDLRRVNSLSNLKRYYDTMGTADIPSFILSDYNLPDGNAIDVIDLSIQYGLDCPIAIVSGSSTLDIVRTCCNNSFDGRVHSVLSKPFSLAELLDILTFQEYDSNFI